MMDDEKLLLTMAIVAVGVSLVAAGVTYFTVGNLISSITGFGTTGEANLTVETLAQVNFSTASIDFGSGRVNTDATAASLSTIGAGDVTSGNWTTAIGLVLENTGNVNVSLNLSTDKTAAGFIGGTSPAYEWNITNNETGSCLNTSGEAADPPYFIALLLTTNSTLNEHLHCPVFQFKSTADQIKIDLNITIPEDSSTGALRDQINATVYT
jgi:hypothetical protein